MPRAVVCAELVAVQGGVFEVPQTRQVDCPGGNRGEMHCRKSHPHRFEGTWGKEAWEVLNHVSCEGFRPELLSHSREMCETVGLTVDALRRKQSQHNQ